MFYDEDWKELARKHPLGAQKIEELRCETVNYEQYSEEQKEQNLEIKRLRSMVKQMMLANGIITKKEA